MRVEYDRAACSGWFQCVQDWAEFKMNPAAGKADLNGAEESDNGIFTREVPDEAEELAINAAKSCPVDAIRIYEGSERIVPGP